MKAYCINLDRRPDRLAYMTEQFQRHSIPFERISAVDGQDPLIAAEVEGLPLMAEGVRMSAGAYGCFKSHREAWLRLLDSGDSHAMVFEDDLLLAEGLAEYLDTDWIPKDAQVVKMETWGCRVHVDRGSKLRAGRRHLVRLRSTHQGTGCYVISAKAAEYLLKETENSGHFIDRVLFAEESTPFKSMHVYQMTPAPVIQGMRAKAADTTAPWTATSIEQRHTIDSTPTRLTKETLGAKIARRARHTLRAVLEGTTYVVIPHG